MKTTIVTLFTALVLSTGIAGTAKAAVKTETETVLNNVSAINAIEVHGNVLLYVSDGSTEKVKVYNKYYSENAMVQNDKGVLRISSYKAEKLVVWVTAKELRSISAFDNAEVRSFGSISKIELSVDLHNTATANLNLDTFSTSLNVSDQAKANLSGTVTEYAVKCCNYHNVDTTSLTAVQVTTITNKPETVKTDAIDDLAGL